MQTKLSVLFYLKKPKGYIDGKVFIYARITVNGKRSELSTSFSWLPIRWNPKGGRPIGSTSDVKDLILDLDIFKGKIYEAYRLLLLEKMVITSDNIKNKLQGVSNRSLTLIPIFQDHNRKFKELVGQEYAQATLTRYETTLRHVQQFLKWKYKIADIDISKIDHSFITEFEFFLRTERKCANNSAVKYLKNFRKIIKICLNNHWITRDPFSNFKAKLVEIKRVYLTEDELQAVIDKELSTVRLSKIRDIFVFSCFTGLAYADAKKLDKSQIVKGIDGENWIYTSRQKTDSQCNIPLLPTAQAILDKYADDPECKNKGILLPILSNQKMNAYLKEIATLCGLNKEFTFHTARHTFATTVTLTNGVPIESVSKMLGHKDIKTTQHYAKILNSKVSNDMQMLKTKLANIQSMPKVSNL